MTPDFLKQDTKPLFPRVLYNRPVTRAGAGRILLTGGHTSEFSQPTAINQIALAAGAGECRVFMPDKLAGILAGAPGVYFGPSTQSGSLSRDALGRILELSEESDALAIGSSLSNNSDTTMLVERLISEAHGSLILFGEGLASAHDQLANLGDRPHTLYILTMPEVFKLCGTLGVGINIRPGGGIMNKLDIVHSLAAAVAGDVAVFGTEIIVASGAEPLTFTPVNHRLNLQPAIFYGVLMSFWIQNRANPAAGLTTGAYVVREVGETFGQTDNPTITQLTAAVTRALRAQEDW
jgi:NAD(P)H-hydrate repair Nnr-like enzyme with NAD(P)H-hydrate dehydratase domain